MFPHAPPPSFTAIAQRYTANLVAVTYDPSDKKIYFSEVYPTPASLVKNSDVLGKSINIMGGNTGVLNGKIDTDFPNVRYNLGPNT